MKNKVVAFFVILLIVITNTIPVFALSWEAIESQAKSFISKGSSGGTNLESSLKETVIDVGQILTTIGLAVVLVGILIIGIKYMMASPEEAAKLKGQLVGLVVSAIVIFGAYGIWNMVVTFLQGLTST